MSEKKSTAKKSLVPVPKPTSKAKPEKPKASTSTPTPTPGLEQLQQEIETLKAIIADHANLILQIQEALARKRKPVHSNGKVQIRDKQTGTVYPSKNNAYQTLLKSGDLKELVDKGLFGDNPQKNTFGWYVLAKEWPDRFEEGQSAAEGTQ